MKFKHWLSAFRLRTLFLSLSCIGGGLICAELFGELNMALAIATLLTALWLQILSNLANDYGDSIHGADHKGRKGPKREVQAGNISKEQMKNGIILFSILSLVSGITLLNLAIDTIGKTGVVFLFILGICSIAAAIAYTNGKRPYGYAGFGDLSVFIFFGLIAVLGSTYLQLGFLPNLCWFPAIAYGCLSVGVLNLNNMRDIQSDKQANKLSIPVRIGLKGAKFYHTLLIGLAGFCWLIFTIKAEVNWILLLPVGAILIANIRASAKVKSSEGFDPLLKVLSISTFLITILFQLALFI